jgi:hypothetical protein
MSKKHGKFQHPMAIINARKQGGMKMEGKDLGIKVSESVKTQDRFGVGDQAQLDRQMKGIGGTLHLTKPEDATRVGELAIELSRQTKLPVIIVVKGF